MLSISPSMLKWGAVALVVAGLATVIGAQRISLANAEANVSDAQRETEQVRRQWADQRVEQERVSRETLQEHQRLANAWSARKLEAYRVQADETLRNQRLAADARTELDRVRDDAAAFAAGRHQAAGDSLAACREDAATLGHLLEGALRADEAHTRAAEEHATDVRALLGAWPVDP